MNFKNELVVLQPAASGHQFLRGSLIFIAEMYYIHLCVASRELTNLVTIYIEYFLLISLIK